MPTLQSTDIDLALAYFDQTRNRVIQVTSGLTEAQWRYKPAPDRWSIAENVEHMVVVQERILGPVRQMLTQAPPPGADTKCPEQDQIVLDKIPDRSIKATAPDFIQPTGQLTPPDALQRISQNYQRLSEFVRATPDLREHVAQAPPISIVTGGAYTHLDGFQWALAVAAHDERHVRQMQEVQSDAGYPRNA